MCLPPKQQGNTRPMRVNMDYFARFCCPHQCSLKRMRPWSRFLNRMMVMQPLYGSIFAVVYSNNLISKVLTFSSLHSKPELRPSRKAWSGSGCYVAIFVVCDFFVNFQESGCILAFLVGYLLRGLFRSGYLWQLYYKELSMGVKWPFSMPTN